jgi:hypothetical protein
MGSCGTSARAQACTRVESSISQGQNCGLFANNRQVKLQEKQLAELTATRVSAAQDKKAAQETQIAMLELLKQLLEQIKK